MKTQNFKTGAGQWSAFLQLLEPMPSQDKLFLEFFEIMEFNPFKPLQQFVRTAYKKICEK